MIRESEYRDTVGEAHGVVSVPLAPGHTVIVAPPIGEEKPPLLDCAVPEMAALCAWPRSGVSRTPISKASQRFIYLPFVSIAISSNLVHYIVANAQWIGHNCHVIANCE